MLQTTISRKRYPSDLTDEQWAILEPLIPPARQNRGGRPREVNMREIVNAIFYVNRSGCQWDMLPHDLLPKSTVYEYFSAWRDDGTVAPKLLAKISPEEFPRLSVIFGDNKYHNHELEAWRKENRPDWRIEVKTREPGTKGFTVLAKRWVVERTNAWNGKARRNSKDYERIPESSAAMIEITNIHLFLNRLSPSPEPAL